MSRKKLDSYWRKCLVNRPGIPLLVLASFLLTCLATSADAQNGRNSKSVLKLVGTAGAPKIAVTPDTIDFGSVRAHTHRTDTSYVILIRNVGDAKLQLNDTNPLPSYVSVNHDFGVPDLTANQRTLDINGFITDTITFQPRGEGFQQDILHIISDASNGASPNEPTVVLRGRGIYPKVLPMNYNFGTIRVGGSHIPSASLLISNTGSEATSIDSVWIQQAVGANDFKITLSPFPPMNGGSHLHLQVDSSYPIFVSFTPDTVGDKFAVIGIKTNEGKFFDTVWGRGVAPWIASGPKQINFPAIHFQQSGPAPMLDTSRTFSVTNTGTLEGVLDSLSFSDTIHFKVMLNAHPFGTLNDTIQPGGTLSGVASFHVVEEGDFVDTVFIHNDSKSKPFLVLTAHIRTDVAKGESIYLDTIRTCQPIDTVLTITNPYPVIIHFDSSVFRGGIDSFAYTGVPFKFPINIPPSGSYPLFIRYLFPPDSFNGHQRAELVLFQRHRNPGEERDTTLELVSVLELDRQFKILTLSTTMPPFAPSATDAKPFSMPILIHGDRANVPELNNWTLRLQFSNWLFEPVGIDEKGSLTESLPNGSGSSISGAWDPTTRIYTIRAVNVPVSDPSRLLDSLLVTLKVRAYVTADTEATITPNFRFDVRPCAFTLEPFVLRIPYADECGEGMIRDMMQGKPFTVDAIVPDPLASGSKISFNYHAATPLLLRWEILTANGVAIANGETATQPSAGRIEIPATHLDESGIYAIRITAVDCATGAALPSVTRRFSVLK